MSAALQVAVVGHTNAGKTSLMRTLTRKRSFGEVSSRPATTRHVELAEIKLGGDAALALYDTPGLEDSSGLLARLDAVRQERKTDWTHALDLLVADPALHEGFDQEAKALGQIRQVDVALYVVDARDPVLGKHKDELEVLGRCAVPVLPVLNFVADPAAREDQWREELARKNMHAIVAFDTAVYDEAGEIALYNKIATMLDKARPMLDRLVQALTSRRAELRAASARIVADLLVDAAAARRTHATEDTDARDEAAADLKEAVIKREAECVTALIRLHGFAEEDYALKDLPIEHGQWSEDPFDPDTLARFGISAGKAAATGAAAGLAVDMMVGGMTLGAAAATGAAVGFLVDLYRKHGARIMDTLSGTATLHVSDATLALLAARNTGLAKALMKRGHGAVAPIAEAVSNEASSDILKTLRPARGHPHWSSLNGGLQAAGGRRQDLLAAITEKLRPRLA